MKILKFCAILLCFLPLFAFYGCGEKELSPAKITRDDARTGGSLSFVYDKHEKKITIGGEGEVVQYSSEDVAKGLQEGTRVGLKVVAPDEAIDLSSATLEMNGVHYASGEFLEKINGQKQRFFEIQPLVSNDDKAVTFVICWEDGSKEQKYQIVIAEGTKFLQKDGSLSVEPEKQK